MTSFKDLVSVRRSHRKYTEEAVSASDLHLIMRAALMAPSSKGSHSYEFCVVEDKAKIKALSEAKAAGGEFLAGAAVCIVVGGRPEVSDMWVEDASIAATMILLQAEDLGLGACWAQMRLRAQADGTPAGQTIRQLLGLDFEPLCVVGLGHKAMERKLQNEDKLLWDKVHKA